MRSDGPSTARRASRLTRLVVARDAARRRPIGARATCSTRSTSAGKPIEQSLKTIRARFTEETTSSLLTRPLVAEGTLIVVRPSDIVLTYTKPERKTLRLDAGQLLFVWPDRGLRETKDIRESQARVQRYFVNKSPDELRRHFTIAASRGQDARRARGAST